MTMWMMLLAAAQGDASIGPSCWRRISIAMVPWPAKIGRAHV